MRQQGMMVLELLFVISLAGLILVLGLERYRAYYQSLQFRLVADDLVTIRRALNAYYTVLPCDTAGALQGGVGQDVIDDLHTLTARAPYVDHYHAYITVSSAHTKDNKPVYHLEVTADINKNYTKLVDYVAKRLDGITQDNNVVAWSILPNTLSAEPKSELWVLNTAREQFKNLKNDAALGTGQLSHAYCFR